LETLPRILVLSSNVEEIPGRDDVGQVAVIQDLSNGLREASNPGWELIIVDSALGGDMGLEAGARLAATDVPVVLAARTPSLALAMEAQSRGLRGVLAFPPDLSVALRLIPSREQSSEDLIPFPEHLDEHALVGRSGAVLRVFETVARVAASEAYILIEGEAGTGRAELARAIHRASYRSDQELVELTVGALPEGLLESELFGHEKGSFPWAFSNRRGRLERADGGTLFLDGVDQLPGRLQARLFQTLKDGAVERTGSSETTPVDVRIIASSTRSLEGMTASGEFHEGLCFRLSLLSLVVPPLRERGSDRILLATHFGGLAARRHGREISGLSSAAAERINGHHWPGNARELRNVMERAVLVAQDPVIGAEDLPEKFRWPGAAGPVEGAAGLADLDASLDEIEAAHIRRVVRTTAGSLSQAADVLGIHRNTLRRKIRQYGISGVGRVDQTILP
jgi:DNA-binding NtrC family response regulator